MHEHAPRLLAHLEQVVQEEVRATERCQAATLAGHAGSDQGTAMPPSLIKTNDCIRAANQLQEILAMCTAAGDPVVGASSVMSGSAQPSL